MAEKIEARQRSGQYSHEESAKIPRKTQLFRVLGTVETAKRSDLTTRTGSAYGMWALRPWLETSLQLQVSFDPIHWYPWGTCRSHYFCNVLRAVLVHTIFHPVNGSLRFSADLADALKRKRPSGTKGHRKLHGR
jgi:hypothetical protein